MKMVGHKTMSVYQCYAIVDEGMLQDGAKRLEALHQSDQGADRQVIPIRSTAG